MKVSNKLFDLLYLRIKVNKYSCMQKKIISNKESKFHSLNKISKENISYDKVNNITKISKKNFFDVFGKFCFKELVFKKKDVEDSYYVPKQKLVFKGGKLRIAKISKYHIKMMRNMQTKVVYTLWYLSLFFAVTSFTTNLKLCIISSLAFYCFTRISFSLNQNKNRIITDIYLLKNGRECEIHTFNTRFVTDIKNIRNISYDEALITLELINTTRHLYHPLAIETHLFLFRVDSEFNHQDIFTAITNSQYIQTNH